MIGTLVKIRDFCSFWYLQYTLITSLYMLEPLERIVFNTLLVVITAMFIYTSFYFMQPYMFSFVNYLTGEALNLFHCDIIWYKCDMNKPVII